MRQIEELRTARERQQLMVENLIQQKEMYKSMVNTNGSSGSQGRFYKTTNKNHIFSLYLYT